MVTQWYHTTAPTTHTPKVKRGATINTALKPKA